MLTRRYGKALEEVWAWREKLAVETNGMSMETQRKYLNERGRALCAKYGLKLSKKKVSAKS